MKTKDDLLSKIFSQIEKQKDVFNVLLHDEGAIVQSFKSWDAFISDTKTKEVKKIGEFSENKNVLLIYAKKGTLVPLTDFECSKTYVFLTGKLRLFFEDKEDVLIETPSTFECDVPHGGEVYEDTYFIVIDEY